MRTIGRPRRGRRRLIGLVAATTILTSVLGTAASIASLESLSRESALENRGASMDGSYTSFSIAPRWRQRTTSAAGNEKSRCFTSTP